MTNAIAYWIAGIVLAVLAASVFLGLDLHIEAGRRFLDLIRAVAFWR